MARSVRNRLLGALGYFVVLELMLFAAIWFWPSFRENIPLLKGLAPLPFMKDFMDQVDESGVAPYVLTQQFFKGTNTLGLAAAVLFGAGAIAGEANRGTLELLLARPVTRTRVLLERWFGGALQVTLPVFLSTASVPWMLTHVDETMSQWGLFLCSAYASLFLLVIYSLTFFLSTLGRQPIAIAFVVLILSTMQFALYMVQTISNWSLFRVVDINVFWRTIYDQETLPANFTWTMLAAVLLLLGSSWVAFQRRLP